MDLVSKLSEELAEHELNLSLESTHLRLDGYSYVFDLLFDVFDLLFDLLFDVFDLLLDDFDILLVFRVLHLLRVIDLALQLFCLSLILLGKISDAFLEDLRNLVD